MDLLGPQVYQGMQHAILMEALAGHIKRHVHKKINADIKLASFF